MPTPFLRSVTLAAQNTAYSLYDLLQALPAGAKPSGRGVIAQFVALQLDPTAGSAILYIGNEGLSSTSCGCKIFSGQTYPIYSVDSNLIVLNDIVLMSDTNSVQVNVSFITR